MKVKPDDPLYWVNLVWLGPPGMTWPWVARYKAYFVWLVSFLGILLFKAVTPLTIGLPPVWEFCIAVLITYAVMGFVDHERPMKSVWQVLRAEARAPRRARTQASRPIDRSLKLTKKV